MTIYLVFSYNTVRLDLPRRKDLISVHLTEDSANKRFDECMRANPSGTYIIETKATED